jgi:hypothetical protein
MRRTIALLTMVVFLFALMAPAFAVTKCAAKSGKPAPMAKAKRPGMRITKVAKKAAKPVAKVVGKPAVKPVAKPAAKKVIKPAAAKPAAKAVSGTTAKKPAKKTK